jgi:IS605 OrfB family transposase
MKIIAHIKLTTAPDQHTALQRTLEQANAACNYISQVAWDTRTFKKFDLQKLVYHDVRDQFALSAQVTVRMLAKVGDAYKLNKQTQCTFKPHGSIAYDDRILSYQLDTSTVNIWTLAGRQRIPFVCGERQRELLQFRQGESDLVLVNDVFYLLAVCDIEEPTPDEVAGILGVDLGISNIASDSDGNHYSGEQVEQTRQRYHGLRQRLQRRGTKSAKRHLKKLRQKQAQFQKDTNHRISKALVARAKDTGRGIALEDLSDIRERTRLRKAQRARHSNWAFAQLRQFISYKAALAGVLVFIIDPAYTSQRCSICGHTERANRPTQAHFCCVSCGHTASADTNAAINISRAVVSPPIVSEAAPPSRQGQAHAL